MLGCFFLVNIFAIFILGFLEDFVPEVFVLIAKMKGYKEREVV